MSQIYAKFVTPARKKIFSLLFRSFGLIIVSLSMKKMNNREKFLKIVSSDKTNTIERAKFRLAKRDLIISSYRVILQRCNDEVINEVLKCVDMTNGWCEMFDEDGNLVSPTFKELGFGYEYFSRKVDKKEIGKSAYWRPKELRILK